MILKMTPPPKAKGFKPRRLKYLRQLPTCEKSSDPKVQHSDQNRELWCLKINFLQNMFIGEKFEMIHNKWEFKDWATTKFPNLRSYFLHFYKSTFLIEKKKKMQNLHFS